MTTRLHDEVLYHIELRVDSALLRRCIEPVTPKTPKGFTNSHFLEACDDARRAQIDVLERFIRPAMHCIFNATDLHYLVNACGDSAVIRVSLEKRQEHANASTAAT